MSMPAYDPIINDLVDRMKNEIEDVSLADARDTSVRAIRRLEAALLSAIGDGSLNLPNIGSDEARYPALRIRGSHPTKRLERIDADETESPTVLVLDASGAIMMAKTVLMRGKSRTCTVVAEPAADADLHTEDLIGVVRAVHEALRRNADLTGRVQNVRDLAAKIEELLPVKGDRIRPGSRGSLALGLARAVLADECVQPFQEKALARFVESILSARTAGRWREQNEIDSDAGAFVAEYGAAEARAMAAAWLHAADEAERQP